MLSIEWWNFKLSKKIQKKKIVYGKVNVLFLIIESAFNMILKLELILFVVVAEIQFLLKIKNLKNMKKVFLALDCHII